MSGDVRVTACISHLPASPDGARLAANGGRPAKAALVAAMRKLLTILNAIIRDGKPWQSAWPEPQSLTRFTTLQSAKPAATRQMSAMLTFDGLLRNSAG